MDFRPSHLVILSICVLLSTSRADIVPADPALNITWPFHTYKTANFTPPLLNYTRTTHNHTQASEGLLFIAPDGATEYQLGPLIMNPNDGELVWNGPQEHAFNFGVQTCNGEPVLVYWNGSVFPEPVGRGNGAVYILDNHYKQIAVVTLPGTFLELTPSAAYPSNIDLHELYLTDKGSVIVTANNVTQFDLSSVGGPTEGWIAGCLVYEIDVATNEVLFEWNSLDHVDQLPLNSTTYELGTDGFDGLSQSTAWGYFHINAASTYQDGYIISSRFLCAAIAIGADGNVKWRLSGRESLPSDFTLGEGADFCYQHDIRAFDNADGSTTLHMHDNANSPIENNTVPTSGKSLHVDVEAKHATLIQRYLNQSALVYATAQGCYQPLPDGNVIVGHGWIPVTVEFAADGTPLNTWQYGANPRNGTSYISAPMTTLSYRSFKHHWVGCPATTPSVVAEKQSNGTVAVFVSWNGATEVKAWSVRAGSSTTSLKHVASAAKTGFETEIVIGSAQYIQVTAVMRHSSSSYGAEGCVCGNSTVTSDVVTVC